MSARRDILPLSLPPRGLSKTEAAAYLGVSVYSFDGLVARGEVPQPKVVGGRWIWDRLVLGRSFESLPDKGGRADVEERWKCAV